MSQGRARPTEGTAQALRELIEYLAKGLVDTPNSVRVTEAVEGQTVVLRLTVGPGELGRVIGKDGRVAKAIRTLLRAAASRRDVRALLDIG